MKRTFALSVLAVTLGALCVTARSFEVGEKDFLLDGKPFVVRCGEVHYARIPRAYWRHRLQMLRAMGCNAVGCYMFWNFHEREKGAFTWNGRAEVPLYACNPPRVMQNGFIPELFQAANFGGEPEQRFEIVRKYQPDGPAAAIRSSRTSRATTTRHRSTRTDAPTRVSRNTVRAPRGTSMQVRRFPISTRGRENATLSRFKGNARGLPCRRWSH